MTIQLAIEKAIEGGWNYKFAERIEVIGGGDTRIEGLSLPPRITAFYKDGYAHNITIADVTYSPLFWRSLGKSMGWGERLTYYNSFTEGKENNDPWRLEWHRFIDHLAEGKDAESFFAELS